MSIVDPIGDMLTRIRNGQMRSSNTIKIPASRFRVKILNVLKDEGYILNYKLSADKDKKNNISVDLKYNQGIPVIREITRIKGKMEMITKDLTPFEKTDTPIEVQKGTLVKS